MIAGSSHVIFIAEIEGATKTATGGASGSEREKERETDCINVSPSKENFIRISINYSNIWCFNKLDYYQIYNAVLLPTDSTL